MATSATMTLVVTTCKYDIYIGTSVKKWLNFYSIKAFRCYLCDLFSYITGMFLHVVRLWDNTVIFSNIRVFLSDPGLEEAGYSAKHIDQ